MGRICFLGSPCPGTDRERVAFTWQGLPFTLTGFPQGLKHGPPIAPAPLATELQTLTLPQDVTVMQYDALAHITSFWISSGRGPALRQIPSREAGSPFSSLFLHPNLQQLSRIPVKPPFLHESLAAERANLVSSVCYLLIDSMKLRKSQMFSFRRNFKMKLRNLWCTEHFLSPLKNWIPHNNFMSKMKNV